MKKPAKHRLEIVGMQMDTPAQRIKSLDFLDFIGPHRAARRWLYLFLALECLRPILSTAALWLGAAAYEPLLTVALAIALLLPLLSLRLRPQSIGPVFYLWALLLIAEIAWLALGLATSVTALTITALTAAQIFKLLIFAFAAGRWVWDHFELLATENRQYRSNYLHSQSLLHDTQAEAIHNTQLLRESASQRVDFLKSLVWTVDQPVESLMVFCDSMAYKIHHRDKLSKKELLGEILEIRNQAARYHRITGDITDIWLAEMELLPAMRHPVELGPFLNAALGEVRAEHPAAQLSCFPQIPSDLPLIAADEGHLKKVFYHLFQNSLRHAAGSPVEIRARAIDGAVEIVWSDAGPGLSEEGRRNFLAGNLFAVIPHSARAGLGFPLVKKLIAAIGGEIHLADSARGLTLLLRLPRYADSQAVAAPIDAAAIEERTLTFPERLQTYLANGSAIGRIASGYHLEKDIKILVVETNPLQKNAILNILGEEKAKLWAQTEPEAILAAVRRQKPDIILISSQAQGLNTHEITRSIRAIPGAGGIPIIMLVGQNEDVSAALRAGVSDFIRLPFSPTSMLLRLGVHYRMANLSRAFGRFVPFEYLNLLGTKEMAGIRHGDRVERETSIVFSDIRSFTEMSEALTPLQTFDFLNSYFSFMDPVMKKNNGFIDKYIGDSIMAIFPAAPDDALRAINDIRRQIGSYNEFRAMQEQPVIESGFGIHFGQVVLGTVGSKTRMETTAIGDGVNLAARLEQLTKIYGVAVIVSDDVCRNLRNPEAFLLREIDTVRVKGKARPVVLYELFDMDPEDIREQKNESRDLFLTAITLYKSGRFSDALALFERCQQAAPGDPLPPIYIKRVKTLLRLPPNPDWQGVMSY